jgi:choline dehydrogenase-like flavoprotein
MAAYDVIIVGSGFGGAIPALRLAQDARKVLCLEWGKRNTYKDFKQTYDLRYLLQFYVTRMSADYKFFVRYARTLGGGSVMFSGAMYRSPTEVFDYTDSNGYKPWPDVITRSVMNPYYDMVEQMLQINQVRWDEVPRSGGTFAKMVGKLGKSCDRGRYNYVNCKQCGFCEAGCIFDRKVTLLHTYIPEAEKRGALFQTNCFATHLKSHTEGYEVFYRDGWEREQSVVGKQVILAGGGVETPAILLRSKNDLPKLSDQVGKNYHNNGDIAFVWLLPETFEPFHLYMGRDNSGMMCYAFWNEHKVTFHPGGPPPAVIAGLDLHRPDGLPWGLEHKQMMKQYYDGRMAIALAIGLLDNNGTISINDKGEPSVEFPMTPHLEAYIKRVEGIAKEIASANNGELIYTSADGYEHGDAHPLAACRMATDKSKGVCDPYGEVFDYPGLFITDGASIPAGTGVNPAHTIAANAERIAAYIVKNK